MYTGGFISEEKFKEILKTIKEDKSSALLLCCKRDKVKFSKEEYKAINKLLHSE